MAKIHEHSPPVAGWCLHCKTRQVDGEWPSPCVEREDWQRPGRALPEAPRSPACEDVAAIRLAITRIRADEQPKCPKHGTNLYACLRTPSPCQEGCPFKDDWIGPEREGSTC